MLKEELKNLEEKADVNGNRLPLNFDFGEEKQKVLLVIKES